VLAAIRGDRVPSRNVGAYQDDWALVKRWERAHGHETTDETNATAVELRSRLREKIQRRYGRGDIA
jgi:hypothetical protein